MIGYLLGKQWQFAESLLGYLQFLVIYTVPRYLSHSETPHFRNTPYWHHKITYLHASTTPGILKAAIHRKALLLPTHLHSLCGSQLSCYTTAPHSVYGSTLEGLWVGRLFIACTSRPLSLFGGTGKAVAFGQGFSAGNLLALPRALQMLMSTQISNIRLMQITAMTIIIGVQRALSEVTEVDWRRASGAMSEIVVLPIIVASSLETERTVSAGKPMSTATGSAAMIVGKRAYKRTKRTVCEGRRLRAM
jgi:hypothetical protein